MVLCASSICHNLSVWGDICTDFVQFLKGIRFGGKKASCRAEFYSESDGCGIRHA